MKNQPVGFLTPSPERRTLLDQFTGTDSERARKTEKAAGVGIPDSPEIPKLEPGTTYIPTPAPMAPKPSYYQPKILDYASRLKTPSRDELEEMTKESYYATVAARAVPKSSDVVISLKSLKKFDPSKRNDYPLDLFVEDLDRIFRLLQPGEAPIDLSQWPVKYLEGTMAHTEDANCNAILIQI